MTIYLAICEWAMENASGVTTEAFYTPEKAREKINQWIEEEKNESWIGAFDENGILFDEYIINSGVDYWSIWEKNNYNNSYANISIRKLEVK